DGHEPYQSARGRLISSCSRLCASVCELTFNFVAHHLSVPVSCLEPSAQSVQDESSRCLSSSRPGLATNSMVFLFFRGERWTRTHRGVGSASRGRGRAPSRPQNLKFRSPARPVPVSRAAGHDEKSNQYSDAHGSLVRVRAFAVR